MPPPQLFTVAPALYGIPTPNLTREQQQPTPPAPLPRFPHPGLGAVTRRGRSTRRDPLEPKQNKTPFNFFSIDARARAKAEHPTADQKVTHLILGNKSGLIPCQLGELGDFLWHSLTSCIGINFFSHCRLRQSQDCAPHSQPEIAPRIGSKNQSANSFVSLATRHWLLRLNECRWKAGTVNEKGHYSVMASVNGITVPDVWCRRSAKLWGTCGRKLCQSRKRLTLSR